MKKSFILAAAALLLAGCGVYTGNEQTTEAVTEMVTTTVAETTEMETDTAAEETDAETTAAETTPEETTTVEETTTEAVPVSVAGFKAGRATSDAVAKINSDTAANKEAHIYDIFNMSFTVAGVSEMINSYTFPDAHYQYGQPLTDQIIAVLQALRNLETLAIESSIDVKYGILTCEADIRSFPSEIVITKDDVYNADEDADYLQESTFYAGEAVAILHTSTDSKYYFVVGRDYYGWVKASDIHICSKEMAYIYTNADSFALVKSAFIYADDTEEIYLSMGTALPYLPESMEMLLATDGDAAGYLYLSGDRLLYSDTEVSGAENLPIKKVATASYTVNVGYMDFTEKNVLSQAKELEGCQFSWGGKGLGYDCSAVCRSVYRCFGIVLPRNSSAMKYVGMKVTDLSALTNDEKATAIKTLPVGSIILMPGHAMFYVGDGEIIHSIVGYVENGVTHKSYSVVETSLNIQTLSGDDLLDGINLVVSPSYQ